MSGLFSSKNVKYFKILISAHLEFCSSVVCQCQVLLHVMLNAEREGTLQARPQASKNKQISH